jgi:hypothetical protein
VIAADIAQFAIELVGGNVSPREMALARAAAEAQSDLRRIRHERKSLLASLMGGPSPDRDAPDDDTKTPIPHLISRLDRYERGALRRRDKPLSGLSRTTQLPVFR